jgi:hypothetical protein
MADEKQLAILKEGPQAWNGWRSERPHEEVDFRGADLSGADLFRANLRLADLRQANLRMAALMGADLSDADLRGADIRLARLHGANLSSARLNGADLRGALLVRTRFVKAELTGCRVHGISAWNLNLEGAIQADLIITQEDEPAITVDNIEVAQFIYLLINNRRIRHVIETITSKVVLILGRFTPERKAILDALREELRTRDYLPVLFDFERPTGQTITETVSLLARMARFVVADITDAKSIPQELGVIVPDLPSVPVQPLMLEGRGEYGMFEHFRRYPWVLPIHVYGSPEQLITEISKDVLAPVEAKVLELRGSPPVRHEIERRDKHAGHDSFSAAMERMRLLTEVATASQLGFGRFAHFQRALREGRIPKPDVTLPDGPRWSEASIARWLRRFH